MIGKVTEVVLKIIMNEIKNDLQGKNLGKYRNLDLNEKLVS